MKSHYSNDYDNLLVVDFDLTGPISYDGLATTFSFKNWDMMSSYGVTTSLTSFNNDLIYYDQLSFVRLGEHPKKTSLKTLIMNNILSELKRGDIPILVNSAFGGLSFYNINSLVKSGAQYDSKYNEHVCLHLEMAKMGYGKLFLNPSFTVLHIPKFHHL